MTRIAHVAESFAYGTAKSVLQLARCVDDSSDVTVFHGHRQGSELDVAESGGVRLVPLPGSGKSKHPKNLMFLRKALRGFDVVHGHSSYGGLYAKLLGPRLFGGQTAARTLYSPRGYGFLRMDLRPSTRRLVRMIERATTSRCTTVACGPYEAVLTRELGGEVLTINNGFTVTDPPPVGELNGDILGVGRICLQKGFDRFAEVAGAMPDHRFRWVGDPQRLSDMPSGTPANLTIDRYLPHAEMLRAIRDCRVIFLPSRWEGLSRFLIEAVCSGKAIVTSDFAGNLDCLDRRHPGTPIDGEIEAAANGFAATTTAGYVDAIRRLDDDAALGRAQHASRDYAGDHFEIDSAMDRWRAMYAAAAEGRSFAAAGAGGVRGPVVDLPDVARPNTARPKTPTPSAARP